MNNKQLSKFLSYLLRHKPETLQLNMDQQGWVDLEELLEKMQASGKKVSHDDILEVVATDNKQRYKIDRARNKIRANQGHSINIDLSLKAQSPPPTLFHGTAERNISAIKIHGLKKMKRQHVHLSELKETARSVGQRYGKPIILEIDCVRMQEAGMNFFKSENGVWLCDQVPAEYIDFGE